MKFKAEALWLLAEVEYLTTIHKEQMVPFDLKTGSKITVGTNDPFFIHNPEHKVSLKSFRLDRFEVSVGDYQRFLSYVDHYHAGEAADAAQRPLDWSKQLKSPEHPVRNVSYTNAMVFARWAGKRLPTEFEWEAAARVGGGPFAWGLATPNDSRARFGGEQGPVSVRSLQAGATPDGLLHMTGNVAEWTSTLLDLYPGGQKDAFRGFPRTRAHVVRGAHYGSEIVELRVWLRDCLLPSERSVKVGFRCAANP